MYSGGPVYFPGAGLRISFKRRALHLSLPDHISQLNELARLPDPPALPRSALFPGAAGAPLHSTG